MKNIIQPENRPSESMPGERQRDSRAAALLFHAATLGAAVVVCALIGPKVPPFAGD